MVVVVVVVAFTGQKEELSFLGNILNKTKFKIRAVFPDTSNSTGFKSVKAFNGLQAEVWNNWPIFIDPIRENVRKTMKRYLLHMRLSVRSLATSLVRIEEPSVLVSPPLICFPHSGKSDLNMHQITSHTCSKFFSVFSLPLE